MKREHPNTCYTTKALESLRSAWNKRHPDRFIKETRPMEIWQQLRLRLGSACRSEACWLRQQFAKTQLPSDILAYTFAPALPQKWLTKPSTWLNSDDINAVMKQVEYAHPEFGFFGPSPIDFDKRVAFGQCVWNDICGFDVAKQVSKGVTKFGFIFNTDPHYNSGEHWIALFVDATSGEITYMDSYGHLPPPEVEKLVARIAGQLKALGVEASIEYITKRHQLGNSECGMYCLFFIISLLEGKYTRDDFQRHRFSDNDIRALRKVYFNKTV